MIAVAAPFALADEPATGQAAGAYTVFNIPGENGERDLAIEDHLIELIDDTPAGEQIDGSMWSWTRPTVAEALDAAQQRGVDVRLSLDEKGTNGETNNDPDNAAMQTLQAADLSELVFCEESSDSEEQQTGCIADRDYSINHNKLFSFSQTGDLSEVVFSTSQNLTNAQNNSFNDAVVIHGDTELYEFFGRHFANLAAQESDNDYFNSEDGRHIADDGSVAVSFSPRADSEGGIEPEAATDTVALALADITEPDGDCTVDLSQAMFSNLRLAVADELERAAGLGCDVRVAYGMMDDGVYEQLSEVDNIELKRYDHNPDTNLFPVTIHSKYISFAGSYEGQADREIVFSGSHNLTGPALRNNDETLMHIEMPEVASGYAENFEVVWSRAECENPSSGTCP